MEKERGEREREREGARTRKKEKEEEKAAIFVKRPKTTQPARCKAKEACLSACIPNKREMFSEFQAG